MRDWTWLTASDSAGRFVGRCEAATSADVAPVAQLFAEVMAVAAQCFGVERHPDTLSLKLAERDPH